MSQKRKKYSVSLSDAELKIIDDHAANHNVTRSELIRDCALQGPSGIPQGSQVYADALEAAARSYSGIPRTAMAGIVSAVITSLAKH
jgi:hypothetical protein